MNSRQGNQIRDLRRLHGQARNGDIITDIGGNSGIITDKGSNSDIITDIRKLKTTTSLKQ